METLRKAMLHTEGPVPGSITLTIARRASSPGPTRNASRRNSASGLLNNSSSGKLSYFVMLLNALATALLYLVFEQLEKKSSR